MTRQRLFLKEKMTGLILLTRKKVTGLREGPKFIALHEGKWEILSPEKSQTPSFLSLNKIAARSFSSAEEV